MSYMPLQYIISQVSASTQSTNTTMINGSGSTLAALTPVRVDANGRMQLIDVSLDSSALCIVGITGQSISNNASGLLVTQGRQLDITTSFAAGDYVYVSKTGTLTNVLPEAGSNGFVTGDYIIRVGVIARNETDSNKKDIFVGVSIVGQL